MDKELKIPKTVVSPSINLNADTGLLQIHGSTLPENSLIFYKPVLDWLDKYVENPNSKTNVEFRMILINTSSSKVFIDIFRRINQLVSDQSSEVTVYWYYEEEDEDIYDMGMQYKEFCKAQFNIVSTEYRLLE